MKPAVTIDQYGVDGVHERGTANLRSLDLPEFPFYIDHVSKGEGRESYCITYKTKLWKSFQRLEEEETDTIFFLCDAEKGRFETYVRASEIRTALRNGKVRITVPGSTHANAVQLSRKYGYPCQPGPVTNGGNTPHVKVPVDFLQTWELAAATTTDDDEPFYEEA